MSGLLGELLTINRAFAHLTWWGLHGSYSIVDNCEKAGDVSTPPQATIPNIPIFNHPRIPNSALVLPKSAAAESKLGFPGIDADHRGPLRWISDFNAEFRQPSKSGGPAAISSSL
jgi:hypothetical protein